MQGAVFSGLGADQERLVEGVLALGSGELARLAVDLGERDAARSLERHVGTSGERRLHEFGPDRQRRLRAAQPELLVVVVADPYDGQKLRREAGEPRIAEVVGGAGL